MTVIWAKNVEILKSLLIFACNVRTALLEDQILAYMHSSVHISQVHSRVCARKDVNTNYSNGMF